MALLDALAAREWSAAAAGDACVEVLGRADADIAGALRFACEIVVPRLAQTTDELTNIVAALAGHHVPAGPSGAPTRGRPDVLPTGRNFYSVDPRGLPSQLSWETGQRLAAGAARPPRRRPRRAAADGRPRRVGDGAMRTQGDDAAEIFALLGVRPVWARESRRVTGLEVIPLEELGRPRIDVTVRISGFFRDAFPHLVRMLDDAVALVAALDEPSDQNFVAAHAREDAEALAGSLGRRARLAAGHDAHLRLQARRLRRRPRAAARRARLARRRRPRRGLRGVGRLRLRPRPGRRAGVATRTARASGASTSR